MLKMKDNKELEVEELSWSEARIILKPLNQELVEIIDEISPGKDYKLYKAKYPFGAKIIDKTEAYLPLTDGSTVSFHDPLLPTKISKNLYYDKKSSNPVGIVLSKKSEFFLTVQDKIMPYMVVEPGDIFGLARILDNIDMTSLTDHKLSFFLWELTSGIRSILMLPKISDNLFHNRLKKTYGLSQEKPNSLQEQWLVFREISQKEKSPWRSEFMFFSNQWTTKLKDPAWSRLYGYFQSSNRLSYWFWRNLLSWQITFNLIEQSKNIRVSTYTTDTAKHLFAIGVGSLPGFMPSTDESSAPIRLLQEAYINGYDLNDYWPVFMEISQFSLDANKPVYYSLNYPTLAQSDPQAFKGKSFITLLDELQRVTERYQDGLQKEPLAIASPLFNAAQLINFSFYHNDPGRYENIKNDELIPLEDSRFIYAKDGDFPKHSAFLKGCIKISSKNGTS